MVEVLVLTLTSGLDGRRRTDVVQETGYRRNKGVKQNGPSWRRKNLREDKGSVWRQYRGIVKHRKFLMYRIEGNDS